MSTVYYVAMRWDYTTGGRTFWRDARVLLVNPDTGASVVVRPVDWGPNTSTRRTVDASPRALHDLGLSTDGRVLAAFARGSSALGRVRR
jgi:rare lipoprotein A (peptidoglycan hydrolase)